jgi:hypothetical protein
MRPGRLTIMTKYGALQVAETETEPGSCLRRHSPGSGNHQQAFLRLALVSECAPGCLEFQQIDAGPSAMFDWSTLLLTG